MKEKMKRPGVKKTGWVSNEDLIAGAIEEVEYFLGALSAGQKDHLYSIFFQFFYNGKAEVGTALKATKDQFKKVDKACSKLMKELKAMMKNPSCVEAMRMAGLSKIGYAAIKLESQLKSVGGACYQVQDVFPKKAIPNKKTKLRWDPVNPEGDLVYNLAVFYEGYTGTPARKAIFVIETWKKDQKKDGPKVDKYHGPFFDFICSMSEFLGMEKRSNETLGVYLYRNIPPAL